MGEGVALLASPCIILRVGSPTTGSTGPRVGVVPLPDAKQNVFRMSRLAPLVSPLVTRGRGCSPHGLSLHYIASLGSDHGYRGSTGSDCKRLGEIQKHFSRDQGRAAAGEPPAPHGYFDVGLGRISAPMWQLFRPPSGFFLYIV